MGTRKITVPPIVFPAFKDAFEKMGFTFGSCEHALWRAAKNGLTVTLYNNGTFLMQGSNELIEEAANIAETLFPSNPAENAELELGLDESGKGDYFGPLVLAGAIIPEGGAAKLKTLGITDSKKMTDVNMRKVFQSLTEIVRYEVRVIEPSEYNELYRKHGNLNKLMTAEYQSLIARFELKDFKKVILDKFSQSSDQNREIASSVKKTMLITEKGERFLCVAAASVIARCSFTRWMENKSDETGILLPRGSGPEAGKLFSKLKKELELSRYEALAKTHFKEQTSSSLF